MADGIHQSFASHALALSVQRWVDLGRGEDPMTGRPASVEEAAIRITHIMAIRLLALHQQDQFVDLATSTIARAVVTASNEAACSTKIEQRLTPSVMMQLEMFVTCMLNGYNNELPFHNYQHAYHVVISSNKFIESMLSSCAAAAAAAAAVVGQNQNSKPRHVYGLASDPLKLLALIFAALIHDVGHTGVTNFQRAQDDPDLAQKYNFNASIHEHHSLYLAFSELMKDEYQELRNVMFCKPTYLDSFRRLVTDAVLSTDIANPERAEDAKIKFFDAFPMAGYDEMEATADGPQRRSSLNSNISMPRARGHFTRRYSGNSVDSDITMDSYSRMMMMMQQQQQQQHPQQQQQQQQQNKPSSRQTVGSQHGRADSGHGRGRLARRYSIDTVSSNHSEFAADSICMTKEKPLRRRTSTGYGQRRLSASHSTESSGLIAMALEVRRIGGVRRNSLTGDPQQQQQQHPQQPRRNSTGEQPKSNSSAGSGPKRMGRSRNNYKSGSIDSSKRGTRQGVGGTRNRSRSADFVDPGVVGHYDEDADYDGDSSLSLSEDEDASDGVVISRMTRPKSNDDEDDDEDDDDDDNYAPKSANKNSVFLEMDSRRIARRLSNNVGVDPSKQFSSIEEEVFGSFNDTSGHADLEDAIHGHTSDDSTETRSMEDGQMLGSFYEDHPDSDHVNHDDDDRKSDDNEDGSSTPLYANPDELQACVIIELCLRAADVAHWYQSWETMTQFNRCIFLELCRASKDGRGFDPRPNWFDNQAKIMETYLLPLAEQIQYINILRRGSDIDLVTSLESNSDLWLVKGMDLVDQLKAEADS